MNHAVVISRVARKGKSNPENLAPVFTFLADGNAETPSGGELELIKSLLVCTLGEVGAELSSVRITGKRGAEYVFEGGPYAGTWYRRITRARADQVN